MSALGPKAFAAQNVMSALPPIATSIAFFGISALAKSRKSLVYSITSSARKSSDGGIVLCVKCGHVQRTGSGLLWAISGHLPASSAVFQKASSENNLGPDWAQNTLCSHPAVI
jgi:hypothetical protein